MPSHIATAVATKLASWWAMRRPTRESLVVAALLALIFGACYLAAYYVRAELLFKPSDADIILRTNDGEVVISSRPSDALAIALRATCPIYASEDLLEMVGEVQEDEPVNNEAEIIDEFRDFIENISPEDFSD